MKKWLALTLLLFCIPALVWGWGTVIISGSVSDSNCNVLQEYCDGPEGNTRNLGDVTDNTWLSTSFIADSTSPICAVKAYLSRPDSIGTMTITACIYTDNGSNKPDTQIGTCSVPINQSDLSTTPTEVTFTGLNSGNLVVGNTYHVVLKASEISSTAYVIWSRTLDSNCEEGDNYLCSWDGSAWTPQSSTYVGRFKGYSQ